MCKNISVVAYTWESGQCPPPLISPPRILKRCETISCTAVGSLHCRTRFCMAWTASSMSWALLAFSWPGTQTQKHFNRRKNSTLTAEHQIKTLCLTRYSLSNIHGILTEIQSYSRQQVGNGCRDTTFMLIMRDSYTGFKHHWETVSLCMAFSGLRSIVFCMAGSSSSLKSGWVTWRSNEALLSRMCCCGFVLLMRTDLMYRSSRALWDTEDTKMLDKTAEWFSRTEMLRKQTSTGTHLMLLYCSFILLSCAEVQTHSQHGQSCWALIQSQQSADVKVNQSRLLLETNYTLGHFSFPSCFTLAGWTQSRVNNWDFIVAYWSSENRHVLKNFSVIKIPKN